jgi:hypothetical protein
VGSVSVRRLLRDVFLGAAIPRSCVMHRAVSYSKISKPISGDAVRVTVGMMGILGMSGIIGVPDPEDTGATEEAAIDLRFDDLRDTIEENENVLLFARVWGM